MKTENNNLRELITEKYGSIKRFADISGMTYSKAYNCVIGKNKHQIEIEKSIDVHVDKMRNFEVSSEFIKKVRQFVYENYKNNSEFCRINKIPYTWFSLLLNGRVRFKNKRTNLIEKIMSES